MTKNQQPKLNEFCSNELATPNLKASKEFYGNVFAVSLDHDMNDYTYTLVKKMILNLPAFGLF